MSSFTHRQGATPNSCSVRQPGVSRILVNACSPFAIWREAVDRLEHDINRATTRNLGSGQCPRVLALAQRAPMGTQRLFDRNLARVFEHLGLPHDDEVETLGETLHRMEHKLGQLLPPRHTRLPQRKG